MSDAVERLGEFLNQPGIQALVEHQKRNPHNLKGASGGQMVPTGALSGTVHDPVRPRPLRDGERIWTLHFGATHLEYELADSPSGRGLDTYAVGRVGPAFRVLGWPRG